MPLLLLSEDELRQTVTIAEAIEAVKGAFAALAKGRPDIPGNFILKLPDVNGEVVVKGAHLQDSPYFVVRMKSNFRDNPTIYLPSKNSFIIAFDAATGFPAAIILDNGYLTTLRAGATGAIAADYLANKTVERVAVVGTGKQAYIQLKSLMSVRTFTSVSVWARSPLDADNYARRIVEDHDLDIQIASSVKEAVQQADIIITATASQEPLIKADWLKPGVHITAVGSDTPTKRELDADVLERADIIFTDNFDRCAIAGEIHHGLYTGIINRQDDIRGELSQLVAGEFSGRTQSDQITLADLTGLDSLDVVVATLAMEKALFLGLGQPLEVGLAQQEVGTGLRSLL